MSDKQKIAVAGATGRLGSHLVEVLDSAGHEVVPMSRSTGVDTYTGQGLSEALDGVDTIIDAASTPTPDQEAATDFFVKATGNLHEAGQSAGVDRLIVVSIIGTDKFDTGYNAAKNAQEAAAEAGPIPAQILRAAQFHEFVEQLVEWFTQDGVSHVPRMRTQLVAARTVAEKLAEMAAAPEPAADGAPISEIAGPRAEDLVEVAKLLVAHRGSGLRIEAGTWPDDPEGLYEKGALLPGPDATLAGPTYEEWLRS